MKDVKAPRKGIIYCNDIVLFYADDYRFHFMSECKDVDDSITLKNEDGFIFGKTYDDYQIAIYTGNLDLNVCGTHILDTSAYVISAGNMLGCKMRTFTGITFVGGTLNALFSPSIFKTDRSFDQNELRIQFNNDSCNYALETKDFKCKITIGSKAVEKKGITGTSIENTEVLLSMEFDTPQMLSSVLEHYNAIQDLLSFMTFRNNVGFDEVLLQQNYPVNKISIRNARLYVKEKEPFTTKKPMENLRFTDLGQAIIPFLKMIYESKDKKPSYSLGFIPKNDDDFLVCDNDKVKAICSGIECELNFIDDIRPAENSNLEDLTDQIKRLISEHRKSTKALDDRTYDMILGSMSHWSMTLADRIIELYKRHYEIMINLPIDFEVSELEIKNFVKYRNDITHGKHRIITQEIANASYVLSALIYCALLNRIGIDNSKIKGFCIPKLLF